MRVLIVDDDPALANDLAPRLRREGLRVYVRVGERRGAPARQFHQAPDGLTY